MKKQAADISNVVNCLKNTLNNLCEKGHEWYPEAIGSNSASVLDIGLAISILERELEEGRGKLFYDSEAEAIFKRIEERGDE